MRATMRLFCYLVFSTLIIGLVHAADTSSWYQLHTNNQSSDSTVSRVEIPVEVFLTSSCPHCKALSAFLEQYQKTHHWITVHRYYIDTNKAALEKFNNMTQSLHIEINQFVTPAVFFCDSRWLGFDTPQHLGKALDRGLSFCKRAIIKDGHLSRETILKLRGWGDATIINPPFSLKTHQILYPLAVAFLDSMSSGVCVWIIVAFLLLAENKAISYRAICGLVMLVVMVHFCQQIQIAFFVDAPHMLKWLAFGLGIALLALLWKSRESLWLQSHLNIYLGLSAITVAIISLFQGRQIPNFSIVFEQNLQIQHIGSLRYWATLYFYQIIYGFLLCFYIYFLQRILLLFKKHAKYVRFFCKGVIAYTALYLMALLY